MPNLAVVIVAQNEADNIQRCVRSALQVTDKVYVFLNDSTDNTDTLALDAGATVFLIKWSGYGGTKNTAVSLVAENYILSLDADEEISPELAKSIKEARLSANRIYAINRRMYYEGQWIHHSGWYPDWCPRIYHKKHAAWSLDEVHEKLIHKGLYKEKQLEGHLNHYSYRSIEDHKKRIQKYAQLKAKKWLRTSPPSWGRRHLGGIGYFIKSYLLKKGFLDGRAGWTIAKMNYFMARTQIREYDRLKRQA